MLINHLQELLRLISATINAQKDMKLCTPEMIEVFKSDAALIEQRINLLLTLDPESFMTLDEEKVLQQYIHSAEILLQQRHHGTNFHIIKCIEQAAILLNQRLCLIAKENPLQAFQIVADCIIPLSILPVKYSLALQRIKNLISTNDRYALLRECNIFLVGSQAYMALFSTLDPILASSIKAAKLMERSDLDIRITPLVHSSDENLEILGNLLIVLLQELTGSYPLLGKEINTVNALPTFMTIKVGDNLDVTLSSQRYYEPMTSRHVIFNIMSGELIVPCMITMLNPLKDLIIYNFPARQPKDRAYQLKVVVKFLTLKINLDRSQLEILEEILCDENVIREFQRKYPKFISTVTEYLSGDPILDSLIYRLADLPHRAPILTLDTDDADFISNFFVTQPENLTFTEQPEHLTSSEQTEQSTDVFTESEHKSRELIESSNNQFYDDIDQMRQRLHQEEHNAYQVQLISQQEEAARTSIMDEVVSFTTLTLIINNFIILIGNEIKNRLLIISQENNAIARIQRLESHKRQDIENKMAIIDLERKEELARVHIQEAIDSTLSFYQTMRETRRQIYKDLNEGLVDVFYDSQTSTGEVIDAIKREIEHGSKTLECSVEDKDEYSGLIPFLHSKCFTRYFESPLNMAIRAGNIEIIKKFLQYEINIDDTGPYGYTALHNAIIFGRLEIMKLLLERGANVNQLTLRENVTPLHIAIEYNRHEFIHDLIIYGADPIIEPGNNVKSPLDDAIRSYEATYIEELKLLRNIHCIGPLNAKSRLELSKHKKAMIKGQVAARTTLSRLVAACYATQKSRPDIRIFDDKEWGSTTKEERRPYSAIVRSIIDGDDTQVEDFILIFQDKFRTRPRP